MNREIKFRGKETTGGDWVYGYYRQFMDKGFIMVNCLTGNVKSIEVIPETVGQYIGRHDNKGKEIYEGDKIKELAPSYRTPTVSVVKFVNNGFWCVNDNDEPFMPNQEYREVIGNIYTEADNGK